MPLRRKAPCSLRSEMRQNRAWLRKSKANVREAGRARPAFDALWSPVAFGRDSAVLIGVLVFSNAGKDDPPGGGVNFPVLDRQHR